MPLGPIVDSHVHLWDPDGILVPWLKQSWLNAPHGLAEYDKATEGVDIGAIVYLEIDAAESYRLTEAKQIAKLAERDPRIQGIVACAPLEDGDHVRGLLEDLVEIGPIVKGIRRIYQDEPDPDFCMRPGFVRGVQILPEYGLTCDLCGNATQLASTIELVRQCPGTEFILDHISKPDIRGGQFEPWASQMTELASLPNIVCKISGAVTEADLKNWTVADIRPYVEHALTAFGEDRVVFGGDWPVVTNAAPWRGWVDALDEITADFSDTAKHKLWAENARRFYRLPDGPSA
jgi:L-fuconolactonase